MRYTKRLLTRARAGVPFDQVLDEAAVLQGTLHGTTAHHDAVRAMLDRRRT
jgi:hypothetical protein